MTCSYGWAFRMLQNLTYRILKFWNRWNLGADPQETTGVAETSAQVSRRLREKLRHLHSSAGDLVPHSYSKSFWSSITTRHFVYHICLSCSFQIRYIIIWDLFSKSFYMYTYGESGGRQYLSVISGALGDANWENFEIHLEAVVAEKLIYHHFHPVQRREADRGGTEIQE